MSDLVALVGAAGLYSLLDTAKPVVIAATGAPVLLLTIASMLVLRAWQPSVLGQGNAEYARLINGMATAAVVVGFVSLALDLPHGRPWVFGVLPAACLLALCARKLLRVCLHQRRLEGAAMRSLLAIGSIEAVAAIVDRTRRVRHEGLEVTAACVPGTGPSRIADVPVIGNLDEAAAIATTQGFDAIYVGRAAGWTAADLRSLAWALESTDVELLVDPGLMEVAGPRLHTASVDGMPLLELTQPRFTGLPRLVKACFDCAVATALLLALAPILLIIAVAVALDGGPVLFRQARIGLDGREFRMVKFRSMLPDAEARLAPLLAANEGAGPLFKLRDDPRVTRVGAVLRRYSLDELPQLFNVLGGTMSLVGPRPPLPREVAGYERAAQRKLLVKPGMTGLWQVSGRSDLSWEETVRLDLRYVENWTFALDLQILVRTIRAVLGDGAY